MAITDTWQLDALISPFEGEHPAGHDLRADNAHDSLYQQIKTARSDARTAERLRDSGGDEARAARPDWQVVLKSSWQALAEHSKDLEIAAYLIEALIREQGFAGLRDGFRVVRELVERDWEHLHPQASDHDVASRVAHLAGLNGVGSEGTLIRPILMSPITSVGQTGAFSTADYLQAQQLIGLDAAELERRVADGSISMDQLLSAVGETPIEFFQQLREDILQCRQEYDLMCQALDETCGEHSPHSSNIREALETCHQVVNYLAGEPLPADEPNEGASANPVMDADQGMATTPRLPLRPLQNREEALQTLELVAAYFRRTEPHSPLSYAADRLARWGRLSLPELLNELVPDPHARDYVNSMVGMDDGRQS